MEPFAQVIETLGGQGVIVPLPGESGFRIASAGEGLKGFDLMVIVFSFIDELRKRRFIWRRKYLPQTNSWCRFAGASPGCSPSSRRERPLQAISVSPFVLSPCSTRLETYRGRGIRGSSFGPPWESTWGDSQFIIPTYRDSETDILADYGRVWMGSRDVAAN
jgi:hypothetical protein